MCVHMAKGIFREELRVHTNAVRFSFAPPCIFACLVPYAAPRVIVVVLPFGLPNRCV